MALLVLLRGVNVGGHRRLRPTLLAEALAEFDAVNIGAAGTLVVHKPGTRARLRAALRTQLTEATQFIFCEGRELLRLDANGSFRKPSPDTGLVRFVSFLASVPRTRPLLPLTIPADGEWLVRVTTMSNRLAVGDYRRHMKTIGCLGQLDRLFGTVATTRSWNTVNAILKVLKDDGRTAPRRRRGG